eukprot:1602945-Amphidinium_carterae.1
MSNEKPVLTSEVKCKTEFHLETPTLERITELQRAARQLENQFLDKQLELPLSQEAIKMSFVVGFSQ